MYTRSYYDDTKTAVPEHYSGNAIQDVQHEIPYVTPHVGESKISPGLADDSYQPEPIEKTSEEEAPDTEVGFFGSVKRMFHPKELFRGAKCLTKESISLEEILIIATAALLILSKDGDLVMGLMLLGLLFVT